MPMSIFKGMHTRAWAFPTLWSFLSPRLHHSDSSVVTVFGEWALLSSVLVLYGTYRAHDERMVSVVSAERTYWTDT